MNEKAIVTAATEVTEVVKLVGLFGGLVYLVNLFNLWRNRVRVKVRADNAKELIQSGVNPDSWTGKRPWIGPAEPACRRVSHGTASEVQLRL